MGGRVGFDEGTSCFEKGKKMINTGKIPEGAGQRNFIKFANKAIEIGKQSGRGLRTFEKFGILPEAIFIGATPLLELVWVTHLMKLLKEPQIFIEQMTLMNKQMHRNTRRWALKCK